MLVDMAVRRWRLGKEIYGIFSNSYILHVYCHLHTYLHVSALTTSTKYHNHHHHQPNFVHCRTKTSPMYLHVTLSCVCCGQNVIYYQQQPYIKKWWRHLQGKRQECIMAFGHQLGNLAVTTRRSTTLDILIWSAKVPLVFLSRGNVERCVSCACSK